VSPPSLAPITQPPSETSSSSLDGSSNAFITLRTGPGLEPGTDVVFRVQTTSPANYRVKPSNGRLTTEEPTVRVEITMVNAPVKVDKFLIKYAPVPEGLLDDSSKLLAEAGAAVQDIKLKVLLEDEALVTKAPPNPETGTSSLASSLSLPQALHKIEELSLALKGAQDELKSAQVTFFAPPPLDD